MRDYCPICGAKLHRHRVKRVGQLVTCRRNCQGCDYRDKAIIQPEIILSTQLVRRRTNSPPLTHDPGV